MLSLLGHTVIISKDVRQLLSPYRRHMKFRQAIQWPKNWMWSRCQLCSDSDRHLECQRCRRTPCAQPNARSRSQTEDTILPSMEEIKVNKENSHGRSTATKARKNKKWRQQKQERQQRPLLSWSPKIPTPKPEKLRTSKFSREIQQLHPLEPTVKAAVLRTLFRPCSTVQAAAPNFTAMWRTISPKVQKSTSFADAGRGTSMQFVLWHTLTFSWTFFVELFQGQWLFKFHLVTTKTLANTVAWIALMKTNPLVMYGGHASGIENTVRPLLLYALFPKNKKTGCKLQALNNFSVEGSSLWPCIHLKIIQQALKVVFVALGYHSGKSKDEDEWLSKLHLTSRNQLRKPLCNHILWSLICSFLFFWLLENVWPWTMDKRLPHRIREIRLQFQNAGRSCTADRIVADISWKNNIRIWWFEYFFPFDVQINNFEVKLICWCRL